MVEPTHPGGAAAPGSAGDKGRQNVAAGLVLIALAGLALWLTADLPRGTLRTAGPAMLPQAVAILMAICGAVLAACGWLRGSEDAVAPWSLRGPFFVTLGIALFALTIKPIHFGGFDTVELGLIVSGPLAIIVGGHASPQARLRDLIILALTLTPLCMLLFGDMLNLPIPLLPRAVADTLFAGWSYKLSLRVSAAALLACAAAIHLLTRNATPRPLDVAGHDGSL
jgi:hypothetical protein